MADLRIVDAPVLLQESITDDVKMPTGGLGNYAIRLGDLVWYVVAKENLASKSYVDTSSKGVQDNLDGHVSDKDNPHKVTKEQVGLGNVDNTADIDKPVSNAVNSAIITATNDMATKVYVNQKDNLKADKATTLSGYGITDAYTKDETSSKTEINSALSSKANIGYVDDRDGDLTTLTTTNKTNLVKAINELHETAKGVVSLYNKNVGYGSGQDGWTDLLTSLENGRTQREKNKDRQSIFDFLTKEELTQWRNDKQSFDWSPVAKRAFNQFKAKGGGKLYFPYQDVFYNFNGIQGEDGKWVGIQIPETGGSEYGYSIGFGLEGECPEVTFQCGRSDMIMVRHSSGYCDVRNFTIRPAAANLNSNTNIGYAISPQNWTNPSDNSMSHNFISNVFIHNINRGFLIFCGGIGGAYYNTMMNIHVTGRGDSTSGNVSAYELLSPVVHSGQTWASPANRNVFINCKAFGVNRAFYIESGDTNRFFGCSVEGAEHAGDFTATATALHIKKKGNDNVPFENINNQFFGFVTEACTQDVVLETAHVKIFGHMLDATKSIVTEDIFDSYACTITGGSDASTFPEIINGQITVLYNVPKNWADYRKVYGRTDITTSNLTTFDVNGKQRTFDITPSNSTGLGLIKGNRSVVSKFNKFVDLTGIFAFNPAAADSVITIDLPFIADKEVYFGSAESWSSTYNFLFNVSVGVLKADNSAYVFTPHIAELVANNDGIVDKIRISPPIGGWKYFESNQYTGNMINFNVRYRT